MNRCNFSLVCLVIIATQTMWAHSLVWSLVLGHPVIDMKEESITSQEKDTDLSRTTQKLPSRLTRHHHAQDKCLEDRQCGKGRFCDMHYGVCRPEKSPGFACRRDRMCAKGLHCMYGRCQAKIPSGEEGSRCHGNGDCQPGLCCARRHGESVCQRKLTLGQRCYVPDGGLEYSLNQLCPCESGLICFQLPASEDSTTEKYNSTDSAETFPFWTSTDNLRCQPLDDNHAVNL